MFVDLFRFCFLNIDVLLLIDFYFPTVLQRFLQLTTPFHTHLQFPFRLENRCDFCCRSALSNSTAPTAHRVRVQVQKFCSELQKAVHFARFLMFFAHFERFFLLFLAIYQIPFAFFTVERTRVKRILTHQKMPNSAK